MALLKSPCCNANVLHVESCWETYGPVADDGTFGDLLRSDPADDGDSYYECEACHQDVDMNDS